MFFSRLFHRKKSKWDADEDAYEQSSYAALQSENIVRELHLSDKTQAKNYVVDLCEQMIDTSRDLEDAKAEYQLVTNYLTDIQIIEELTETERKPIVECAMHVAQLNQQRSDFLKTERKLSETQFAQMQEEEDTLPGIINRLKSNENDLDAVRKDMAFLEGKKLEWSMQRTEAVSMQQGMRKAGYLLLAFFATVMILFAVLIGYQKMDLQLPMTIVGFIAAIAGTYILVKYQDAVHEIRQADVNRNHAITLENRAKIKYVNIKNAVDYTCEKYHVHNAYELQYLYEQYQEEMRKRESFRKTNDDLEYYSRSLVEYLTRIRLYDAKVWTQHANAIVDSREMVELKHDLITRRQKLRGRMEYSINSISNMKQEAMKKMDSVGGSSRHQIEQIIRKIEAMNPSF
jgi:hypothetical protein